MNETEVTKLHQDIAQWELSKLELDAAKAKEILLRTSIFKRCFPSPTEGTNTYEDSLLILKATHKLNRSLDAAALPAVLEELPEGTEDRVIKYKPELVTKEYRALSDDDRRTLEQAMTIKPGTPSLDSIKIKE